MKISREELMVLNIAKRVAEAGGRTFYVGGMVRDEVLGKENKDLDIEVHGIDFDKLKEILGSLGKIDEHKVGDSFGILQLKSYDIDIAMPRSEKPSGEGGHKDFIIDVDPYIGYEKAARRRDFTMNALMKDVLSGEVLDQFGGLEDIKNGVIKHVDDETYSDDVLRVLRAAQFAARFDMRIDESTKELSKTLDLSVLSHERIAGELDKALLKSEKPSVFFNELRDMGQLGVWFPEVQALIDLPQRFDHHPEGDVYTHTMLVLDEAAKHRKEVSDPRAFMLSALCHDFGKAVTTEYDEKKQAWTSIGHDVKGAPLVHDFINRVYNEKDLEKYVVNMTVSHMKPLMMTKSGASKKAWMNFYDNVDNIDDLIMLCRCDSMGRAMEVSFDEKEAFMHKMADEYRELMEQPQVMGRDLIELGYKPGPKMGEMVKAAHKAHLAGVDKETAIKQLIGMYGKSDLMHLQEKVNGLKKSDNEQTVEQCNVSDGGTVKSHKKDGFEF